MKSINSSDPTDRTPGDDDAINRKYTAFFVALFKRAGVVLKQVLDEIPATRGSILKQWCEYLALEATEYAIGKNRKLFYRGVVELAEKVLASLARVLKTH
jgi:hypothetical protein